MEAATGKKRKIVKELSNDGSLRLASFFPWAKRK